MKELKKIMFRFQIIVMPHVIVTSVSVIIAILLIYFSGVFYNQNQFISSVLMGIATGVISGIILLIVTGIKNMWLYLLEEKEKWLEDIHKKILLYIDKKQAYYSFCKNQSIEDCYNYVYDLGVDLSNINGKIEQAQFSKILPFDPNKYFLKRYDYDTYKVGKMIVELHETICNSDESEEFLKPKNILNLFEDLNQIMSNLNHEILEDISDKKRFLMLARKMIL